MHILETPRLILRPPSHSDHLLIHNLHNDPFVVDAIRNGLDSTVEQSRAALLNFINHWLHHRFGLWMVFVKDEGTARKFAGYSGLMCSGTYRPEDPNDLPGDPNYVEMVTGLHLVASGRGIGVEAGRAVVQFAFEILKLEKVTAFILPNNTRSLIKNKKIGFFYIDDITHKNRTWKRFEVSALTAVRSDNLRVFGSKSPRDHSN
ncbi:GNAT family N-acetyltransferase [Mesorhizobium sp.]|uniref:GNAT family N-acetyltransferase n=1 Tax=Mesorhizobium sp. TaxID=1871066 RepID=UPI00120EF5A2|nr:GNAT family N-acetyltransferase [Mesorhizobium sp.]TIP18373.1 MAG: GNAT family N-acetyltransferase [Mesorhizobium sp.]